MDASRVAAVIEEGRAHPRFIIKLDWLQLEAGRDYRHEQPASATSWSNKEMVRLLQQHRSRVDISDQCEYGLVAPSSVTGQPVAAKKTTRWATSSPQMAARLSKRSKR